MYTSAIVARRPFSEACSLDDSYQLWTTIWRVPLTRWKSMIGIFLWMMVALMPPTRDAPHGRIIKSMFNIAALTMGIEDWTASSSALKGAIMLQVKLGGQDAKVAI
jgi:hypothetical protein